MPRWLQDANDRKVTTLFERGALSFLHMIQWSLIPLQDHDTPVAGLEAQWRIYDTKCNYLSLLRAQ